MRPMQFGRRQRWWNRGPAVVTATPVAAAGNDWEPGDSGEPSAPSPTSSSEEEGPLRQRLKRSASSVPVLVVVGLGIAGAVGFVATRGGEKAPAPEPPAVATTAATTATSTQDPAQAVSDAFFAYEEAFLAAAVIPDPDHPALRETASGENLADDVAQLRAWQLSGRVVRPIGAATDGVRVVTTNVQPDGTAQVRACITDDDHVVIAATGQVVNDDVVTRLVDLTLVLEGGRWKVSQFRVAERWEGVAGCAANAG